ncbi:hypothetical protein WMY93_014344 [Mugilogobius chulae]|uniref:Poly [ADP-ribose] polymerase n=1 Tax=Mugilogobius chulae TaxID=88201 RepID=A0AAW0NYG7_9GOBI
MLNQTNIGHNNNKFYVIQLITKGPKCFHTWTRWGRVGETGQNKMSSFTSLEPAIKEFEKKFKDKTKNNWSDRDNFVSHPGKYTLIEVDGEQDAEVKVDTLDGRSVCKKVLPCSLDNNTQKLIELIFSNDMFKEAMEGMNLDIKKMPLGKLSKMQIAKGFDVLEEIEAALDQKSRKPVLEELSDHEKKKEMLMVLADIELAQTLKSETEKAQRRWSRLFLIQRPGLQLTQVQTLSARQEVSSRCSGFLTTENTYKRFLPQDSPKKLDLGGTVLIIDKYLNQTKYPHGCCKILNVWEVDRETEGERFKENDELENRRLLWHGTNVAVVAAILKSGLRIMPHSGGRVGRGIYFASENAKSAGYVGLAKNTAIMFLNEVALGKEYTITRDDSSLKKAPKGFDSVVARGSVEPDPSQDITITLDGKPVSVPQGPAIAQPQYEHSSFSNSEYLIYKESQCRIRFLLELHMKW